MILIYILYGLVVFFFSIYSFALVDPNFTPITSPVWELFRNIMVQLGYYQRFWSFVIYFVLVILMFIFQWYLMKRKQSSPLILAGMIGGITLLAFPFLSHDFFNYLFDAKIITYYHQNPYLYPAMHFAPDPDLRFMHWVQRTYPYGPVFLLLTTFASFFSFGKFILSFILFKILWVSLYVIAVKVLININKKAALFFATSPLIIIEGLVNAHNDLIAVSLGIIALYFIHKKRNTIIAGLMLVFSAGIKFTSLPFVILLTKWRYSVLLAFIGFLATLAYGYTKVGIQQWYFLNLWILVPFLLPFFTELSTLSFFLLLSYYPYVVLGGWDTPDKVHLKELLIFVGMGLAFIQFLFHQYTIRQKKESYPRIER